MYEMKLNEKEMIMILQMREENKEQEERKKEKSFLRKYVFNRHTFYDVKQSFLRESMKLIFTIYILERFFVNR